MIDFVPDECIEYVTEEDMLFFEQLRKQQIPQPAIDTEFPKFPYLTELFEEGETHVENNLPNRD